jgi:putative sigma-54 modulation protein
MWKVYYRNERRKRLASRGKIVKILAIATLIERGVTMNLQMKAKHFTPNETHLQYAEKKLGKFDKLLNREVDIAVNCSKEQDEERVEITLQAGGFRLRAEEFAPDFYVAFDSAIDTLERQLDKYKTRWSNKRRYGESIRTGSWLLPNEEPEEPIEDDEDNPQIIRVKRFAMKPTYPEDAVIEMEMLGHSFYMFLNAETEEINVVYRRNDGKYGLIEPELG